MPDYRPLREGERIQCEDLFSRYDDTGSTPYRKTRNGVGRLQGFNGIQYYRYCTGKTRNSPLNILKDLIAIGYAHSFPKWSQWEEIVAAQELVNEVNGAGKYRELKPDELIQAGDEHSNSYRSEWSQSIAIGQLVKSQIGSSITIYRRFVNSEPVKITKPIKAKLIDAIEAILYMGKDEKYNHWEDLIVVVKAYELILKQK